MKYSYFFGSYNSDEGPPKNFKPFSVSIDTVKLGFLFTENSNEEIIESNPSQKNEINNLIVIYQKWFDAFPFDLVVFSAVKDTFENKLPLKYNKENKKFELFTPFELIELLRTISNLFFEQINASTIYYGNVVNDINEHKVKLVLEKRRLKSKLGYPASQNEFSEIVSEWLKDEQDAWEELTPILESTSSQETIDAKKTNDTKSVKEKPLNFSERKDTLESLKPGVEDATKYHDFIFESLIEVFAERLSNPKVEKKINEGRKRVDIVFNNCDTKGFFYSLNNIHHIKCPKIIVECKNYGAEIGNPEFDQISGRLDDKRGRFGIMFCRSINDHKRLLSSCKDLMHANSNYIIVLEDKDILQLLEFRENDDEKSIDEFFESKIDELIM